MVGVTCFLLLYVMVLLLPAIVASQGTVCHVLDSRQPVPEGWGAAYDVFSDQKEVLLQATCTPEATHITVGTNNPHTYIYHYAYQWIDKQGVQLGLQCSGEKLWDAWCVGEATGVISEQSPYFAAYTCRRGIDNSWKCGCRDTQCAESLWQLQKVLPATAALSCSGEGCNGQDPYWTGCYRLAYPVKHVDVTFYIGSPVIMTVSIQYAPDCNAYYGQMDSFGVERTMQVTISRADNHLYGSGGYISEFSAQSLMVGKKIDTNGQEIKIDVHGCWLDTLNRVHCYPLTVP